MCRCDCITFLPDSASPSAAGKKGDAPDAVQDWMWSAVHWTSEQSRSTMYASLFVLDGRKVMHVWRERKVMRGGSESGVLERWACEEREACITPPYMWKKGDAHG